MTEKLSIGPLRFSHPVFPSPLAGITDRPFRNILREKGSEMVYTEMISAEGLIHANQKTRRLLNIDDEPAPFGVQIFGTRLESLIRAAKIVEAMGAPLIDINMGCPARKVTKSGGGSALLREPERAAELIAAVKQAVGVPVTVKIRSGWMENVALEAVELFEQAGADALTLHPRTRHQAFGGNADWSIIREAKQILRIPLIGNGDIRSPEDALEMMRLTGCDGVMVGRGILGNPWLIGQIAHRMEGLPARGEISLDERFETLRSHARMAISYRGEQRAMKEMRKHALWYLKGFRCARVMRSRLTAVSTYEDLDSALRDYTGKAGEYDD